MMTSSGLLFTTDSYVRHRWYCIIWRYLGLSTIHVQFLISEHELAVLAFVCEFLPLFPILFFHEACRTEKSLRNISFRHSDALGAVAANGTWMVPKTHMSLLRLVNRKSDLAPPQKSVPFLPSQHLQLNHSSGVCRRAGRDKREFTRCTMPNLTCVLV